MDENPVLTDTFKKPFLPTGSLSDTFQKSAFPTQADTDNVKEHSQDDVEVKFDNPGTIEKEKASSKKAEKSLVQVPLPYQEPEWNGHPPPIYNLEIIKNGTFVSNLPIRASLLVFGRLEVCDVVFEHPSVSRYHAVIQYCKGDDTHPKGFYLYDLGSTHGTFLNKEKIKPKIYYKLKVGYILKFGGSSRLHIFLGPEEEEEVILETKAVKEPEDDVCSWGMAEEAVEDEDLTENPFAITALNEDLYIDDPKKTLRGWFEREGYELEYNVEEKGFRTFSCTIRLPIDTASGEFLPVEASVSGKKKEAVVACALEACRTLDKMGLLRQSHQESRHRKRKKWEENDYYDSDEDTFYDRTGEIEKRREMRKRLAKKVEVDNFESLSAKLEKLNAEMEEIKNKILSKSTDSQDSISKESDPLDLYMSNLTDSGSTISDKFERRKLKLRLVELEKEKLRLEKLSNIAKPVQMPFLSKHSGIVGKKPKSKLKLFPVTVTEITKSNENEEKIEENDSDEEKVAVDSKEVNFNINEDNIQPVKYGLILKSTVETEPTFSKDQAIEEMQCDSVNIEDNIKSFVQTENKQESDIIIDTNNLSKLKTDLVDSELNSKIDSQKEKPKKSFKSSRRKDRSSKQEKVDVYKSSTTEYCTWMPPTNQSGDGTTHLNAKYGY